MPVRRSVQDCATRGKLHAVFHMLRVSGKARQMESLDFVKRGVIEENDPYTWGLYTEDAGFFSEKE